MGQDLPITSYALLGLLTFGDELTGYELKQRADMTLRFYWQAPAMSQVYSELKRLTDLGYVDPVGAGRATTYRISAQGQGALTEWLEQTPATPPVLKHPVALRLLMGHVAGPDTTRAMLGDYLAQLDAQEADLAGVRESLRGADAPGETFRYPSLVAEWGLHYFAAEREAARNALAAIDGETDETA